MQPKYPRHVASIQAKVHIVVSRRHMLPLKTRHGGNFLFGGNILVKLNSIGGVYTPRVSAQDQKAFPTCLGKL